MYALTADTFNTKNKNKHTKKPSLVSEPKNLCEPLFLFLRYFFFSLSILSLLMSNEQQMSMLSNCLAIPCFASIDWNTVILWCIFPRFELIFNNRRQGGVFFILRLISSSTYFSTLELSFKNSTPPLKQVSCVFLIHSMHNSTKHTGFDEQRKNNILNKKTRLDWLTCGSPVNLLANFKKFCSFCCEPCALSRNCWHVSNVFRHV